MLLTISQKENGGMLSRRAFILGSAWSVTASVTLRARGLSPDGFLSAYDLATQTFFSSLERSATDPGVTAGFEDLLRTRPWLAATQSTVGQLNHMVLKDGEVHFFPVASAVILDNEGTVLFTGHQYKSLERNYLSGAPSNNALIFNRGRDTLILTGIQVEVFDERHDIALGQTVVPAWTKAKQQFGLRAVTLGETNIEKLEGEEVVLVGYPEMTLMPGDVKRPRLLHATAGKIEGYLDSEILDDAAGPVQYRCRMMHSAPSLVGFSGGASFKGGGFVGTNSSGNQTTGPNLHPVSRFVPLCYPLNLYQHFYPDRAARLGLLGPIRNVPESCRFNPQDFGLK